MEHSDVLSMEYLLSRRVKEQAGDKRKEVSGDTIVGKPSGPFKQGPKSMPFSQATHLS